MSERLSRRGLLRSGLPALIGGVAGVVSGAAVTEAHAPPIIDPAPRLQTIEAGQRDLRDRLTMTNQQVSQLGGAVVAIGKELQALRRERPA
ncbi:MAG TPA: hypothetical protein VGM69_02450 [Chloroflexota bacterium]